MKIISKQIHKHKYHWLLYSEYIIYDNKDYSRIVDVNLKISWTYFGTDFELDGDIFNKLEYEYQKIQRFEKLNRILNENY